MKLNVRALATVTALVLGILAMMMTGLANLIWPSYGREFLQLMASVYPGYHATRSLGEVVIGTLYGLVDGGVGGALFAWMYNYFAG
ncbi:MAG: hypothetical protein WAO35_27420 [Terriglobia bacterium]